ncbi:hypothetical protein LIER_34326 [Lithospermum erythrorhizon]|uniref:Retrovirus-related Pol polyprotein from transposon TNT 1-94-like beta-barrel domain-containing protein n=1 Tax=Lithospermum erythrorhizon TaxID=34254 RepID=A0AAV3RZC6_LITER
MVRVSGFLDVNEWVLDSGCSRHTMEDTTCMTFKESSSNTVVFANGSVGNIVGTNFTTLEIGNQLVKVIVVQGMKGRALNISQLCNKGWNVMFTKKECVILNENNQEVIEDIGIIMDCISGNSQIYVGRLYARIKIIR